MLILTPGVRGRMPRKATGREADRTGSLMGLERQGREGTVGTASIQAGPQALCKAGHRAAGFSKDSDVLSRATACKVQLKAPEVGGQQRTKSTEAEVHSSRRRMGPSHITSHITR